MDTAYLYEIILVITTFTHSLLASTCRLVISFANILDLVQDAHNVGPDLNPNLASYSNSVPERIP